MEGDQYVQEVHTSDGYHYSKSAKTVFAVQSGPVKIIWRELGGSIEQPEGLVNIDWIKIKKKYYKLHKKII